MKRVGVDDLPPEPLAAAGVFHQHWLPHVEALLMCGEDVMVALATADHTHREWRRAIAAGLARAHAPRRVNVVAGESDALDAIERYLAAAPGVTGQYLEGTAGKQAIRPPAARESPHRLRCARSSPHLTP